MAPRSTAPSEYQQAPREIVNAIDDTPVGMKTTENIPVPESEPELERPDHKGQTMLDDWERLR